MRTDLACTVGEAAPQSDPILHPSYHLRTAAQLSGAKSKHAVVASLLSEPAATRGSRRRLQHGNILYEGLRQLRGFAIPSTDPSLATGNRPATSSASNDLNSTARSCNSWFAS